MSCMHQNDNTDQVCGENESKDIWEYTGSLHSKDDDLHFQFDVPHVG